MKNKFSGNSFFNYLNKVGVFGKKSWNRILQNRRYIFWGILAVIIFNLAVVVALIIAINHGAFGPIPDKAQLTSIENPTAAEIYTADSVMMGKYYLQNRMDLKRNELTPIITKSLIATEDKRFYSHHGIDVKSLFRVLIKTIMLQKENSGGGSTITQQLAKNLYPRKDFGFGSIVINKIREMVIANKLEKLYTKRQILLLYLNTVPFGEDTYGIKAGALRYFRKNPNQLKTEEVAMLVGMLKGTSIYNPRLNYDKSLTRRNVVLLQMYRYGILNKAEKDSLSDLPVTLNYYRFPVYAGVAPYFRSQMKFYINNILDKINKETGSDYDLYTDGLKIYTSINSKMQEYAEAAVKEHLMEIQKQLDTQWENADWEKNRKLAEILQIKLGDRKNDSVSIKKHTKIFDWQAGSIDTTMSPLEKVMYNMKLLRSGFLVMDVNTGELKAWVGGINHEFFEYDHVTAQRQVGSVFKPFVYLAALEEGIKPCDFYNNQRYIFTQFKNWSPRNSTNEYEGMYSVKGALAHSINTVSAKLITEVGISRVKNIASRSGVQANLPDVPSLALGTAEISLFELVQAYQTIANKGIKVEPKFVVKIENINGEIIYRSSKEANVNFIRVASKFNFETLIEMMKNVVNQGTGARLRYRYHINSDVAGKTGTTQNNADGWFIGFTPDLVAGCWVGAEYPAIHFKNGRYGQGAYTALPIWAGFFKRLYEDDHFKSLEKSRFSIPDSVKSLLQCEDYLEPPELKVIQKQPARGVTENTFSTH